MSEKKRKRFHWNEVSYDHCMPKNEFVFCCMLQFTFPEVCMVQFLYEGISQQCFI